MFAGEQVHQQVHQQKLEESVQASAITKDYEGMGKNKKVHNMCIYPMMNAGEGLALVLQALLPRTELKRFIIDAGSTRNIFELASINDSIEEYYSGRSEQMFLSYNSTAFSTIYPKITKHLGAGSCVIQVSDTLANIFPQLSVDRTEIFLHVRDCGPAPIITILNAWQAGHSNIKCLKIREYQFVMTYSMKWADICKALQVIPISGIGYIKECNERFEIRRECDNRCMDVMYHNIGFNIDLEEKQV